jgi:hypothetical protein
MKRINPKSIENLKPRFAPDRPGETVTLGVRLRTEQRQKLDKLSTLRGVAIGVLVREAIDNYLSQSQGTVSENPPTPAAPDSPPQVDKSELINLLDTALRMKKATDIKPLLEKIRQLLT